MRKQMMEDAAYEVATQVRAVEDSIEAALIEIAALQTKMVDALVTSTPPGGTSSQPVGARTGKAC